MNRTLVQAAGVTLLAIALGSPALAAEGFPVVDPATQRHRDETRQRILQDELTREQALFAQTQQDLGSAVAAGQPPEAVNTLQQALVQHLKNIDALQKELAHQDATVKATQPAAGRAAPVTITLRKPPPATKAAAAPWWDVYARQRRSVYQPPSTEEPPGEMPRVGSAQH